MEKTEVIMRKWSLICQTIKRIYEETTDFVIWGEVSKEEEDGGVWIDSNVFISPLDTSVYR